MLYDGRLVECVFRLCWACACLQSHTNTHTHTHTHTHLHQQPPSSALEPYGWTERYTPQQTQYTLTREEAEELTNLLGIEGDTTRLSTAGASATMGDDNDALPFAAHERLLQERGTDVVVTELSGGHGDATTATQQVLFVVWDGSMVHGPVLELVQGLPQRIMVLNIEQLQCMDRNQIHTLAGVVARRVLGVQQQGPFVLAGLGSGGALAYDACLALQEVYCGGGRACFGVFLCTINSKNPPGHHHTGWA